MDPLLNMAALLFAGLLFSRLIKLLKLPNVTGFLVGGLIIGPSVLGLLSTQGVESLGLISSVALGFIAFSIGSEFKISYLKRVGFLPIVIATFESLFAVVFVVAALAAAGQTLPFSLVLGAIAAATAPAATIMVIKQYRAKGPVTETLLSVVALDDATALIFFGIAVAIAQALESPQHASLLFSVLSPVLQILAALGIGLALGAAHTLLIRFLPARHNRLVLTIAFVLTATAVAELLGLSALLTTMAMGCLLYTSGPARYVPCWRFGWRWCFHSRFMRQTRRAAPGRRFWPCLWRCAGWRRCTCRWIKPIIRARHGR